jgi:HEXXH motif-containing protein
LILSSLSFSRIEERVARRSAARLRRVRRTVSARPWARLFPEGRTILSGAGALLAALPAAARRRLLTGPDIRGFLNEAAIWIEVHRLAGYGATGRPGPAGRRAADVRARLFDRVSRTEHLATLVPRRRLDAAFPARAARFARRRLREALADLAAFAIGLRLAFPGGGRLELALQFREDAEQGRPPDRIDLGAVAGPAGALGIVAGRRSLWRAGPAPGARPGAAHRDPRIRAGLLGRTLVLRAPGERPVILPAAGSRLRFPDPTEAGIRWRAGRRGIGRVPEGPAGSLHLVQRETIPGTPIILAPVVHSRPRRLLVGRDDPRAGPRLARALGLLQMAWPEAFREILRRTWMVVPIREPGTVSYSLASRPGISYINVFGKSLLDLADDLLHETAHHLLHDLQEVENLLPRGEETEEVQAFDSPWRRAKRPLHGLLHGCFTFLFRAELFRRVLRLARARPRVLAPYLGGHRTGGRGLAWVRRELRRENAMIRQALGDLEGAARAGLLMPAGRRLIRRLRAWSARLRPT